MYAGGERMRPIERITTVRDTQVKESERGAEIKRRVFEKVRRKMIELGLERSSAEAPFNDGKTPDVIVTAADHVLLFEPQNWRVAKWLYDSCGLSLSNVDLCDKIPVHPCQQRKIVEELQAAGFEVMC